MKTARNLILICLLALVFRIAVGAAFVRFPGIADPNHYYNMGVRLVEGHGFTIDYLWSYYRPPETLTHPEDFWMPGAAVLAALPMSVFGFGTGPAISLFVLIGSLLPLLSYWGARQLRLSEASCLYAACATAFVPELVLNSVRTDSTVPAALFLCLSILSLNAGIQDGGKKWYVLSGASAGLAYLMRNDAMLLLPTLLVLGLIYIFVHLGAHHITYYAVRLSVFLVTLVVVISPWLMRNMQAFGVLNPAETSNLFFLTSYIDHYTYDRTFTLQTLLATQTPGQIIGKRLFEMAAGLKVMIVGLGEFFALAVAGGTALLFINWRRETARWLTVLPTLIFLFGAFVAYTVFMPISAQGGSFKKAFLMTVPLLLPIAAYAVEQAVPSWSLRRGVMVLSVFLLGAFAFDLVRLDAAAASSYLVRIEAMAEQARELPDINGDDDLIFMTQDPFMLRYQGLQSVAFPHEDRDLVYEIAKRYGVDYLLMPAARPALDPLLEGEDDPRFTWVESVPNTEYSFWRVEGES